MKIYLTIGLIFFGILFVIYVYQHTTPTGMFYSVKDLEELDFLGYYKCYNPILEDDEYVSFINKSVRKYEITFYCDVYCETIASIFDTNAKNLIIKDENEQLGCLCILNSKILCENKNISSDVEFYYKQKLNEKLKYSRW
ncbi:MAG: hypothetical protein QXS41_03335 [Candidatus Woesearchaeota archaeon]